MYVIIIQPLLNIAVFDFYGKAQNLVKTQLEILWKVYNKT